jgi:hypothetical protein
MDINKLITESIGHVIEEEERITKVNKVHIPGDNPNAAAWKTPLTIQGKEDKEKALKNALKYRSEKEKEAYDPSLAHRFTNLEHKEAQITAGVLSAVAAGLGGVALAKKLRAAKKGSAKKVAAKA